MLLCGCVKGFLFGNKGALVFYHVFMQLKGALVVVRLLPGCFHPVAKVLWWLLGWYSVLGGFQGVAMWLCFYLVTKVLWCFSMCLCS